MDEFDPYLKWLGIREPNRPINHYRLLGLDLFESDADVISMAADRQMTHVRTYQNGPHAEYSQQLLNELAKARRCLLVSDQKQAYDEELRRSMGQDSSPEPEMDVPIVAAVNQPTGDINIVGSQPSRTSRRKQEQKKTLWTLVSWISGGVAAVGVSAWLIGSGILLVGQPVAPKVDDDPGPVAIANEPDARPPAVVDRDPPSGEPSTSVGSTTDPVTPSNPNGQPPPVSPEASDTTEPATPTTEPVVPTVAPPADAIGLANPPPASVIRAPFLPPSTRWTLGNSGDYPKADTETLALLNRIRGVISKGKLERTKSSFRLSSAAPFVYQPETTDQAMLVIGFRVWTDEQSRISRVAAVGLNEQQIIVSEARGRATKHHVDLIADPGYCVSGISVSAQSPIYCMRVHFRPYVGSGWKPGAEELNSVWVGAQLGPTRKISAVQGPAVGVSNNADKKLDNIGLVIAPLDESSDSVAVANPPPTSSPFDPTDTETDQPKDSRVAIPSAQEQTRIFAELDRRHRLNWSRFQQRPTESSIHSMALNLESHARFEASNDERYVLLSTAARQHALIGAATDSVRIVRDLSKDYQVDFWPTVQDSLNVAVMNLPANRQLEFKQTVDELIKEAVQQRAFDAAHNLIDGAKRLAKSLPALKSWYRQQEENVEEFQDIFEKHAEALTTLKAQPEDPQANTIAGDYQFIVERSVKEALPFWEKSDQTRLKRLAKLEVETDRAEVEPLVDLCEEWEKNAKGTKRTLHRIYACERAIELYRILLRIVDPEMRDRYTKRLEELQALSGR